MTTCEKFAVIEETLRGEGNLLQVGMLCEVETRRCNSCGERTSR